MVKIKRSAGYASAIETLIENQKTYAVLCGAPLVALVAQLRWIQLVDSLFIKLLLTISILCLFIAGSVCLYFIDLGRNYLAKVRLQSDDEYMIESPYLIMLEAEYKKSKVDLSEECITRLAEKFVYPMAWMGIIGWTLLVVALLAVMWSPPGG